LASRKESDERRCDCQRHLRSCRHNSPLTVQLGPTRDKVCPSILSDRVERGRRDS
jgi:hypothetical protein